MVPASLKMDVIRLAKFDDALAHVIAITSLPPHEIDSMSSSTLNPSVLLDKLLSQETYVKRQWGLLYDETQSSKIEERRVRAVLIVDRLFDFVTESWPGISQKMLEILLNSYKSFMDSTMVQLAITHRYGEPQSTVILASTTRKLRKSSFVPLDLFEIPLPFDRTAPQAGPSTAVHPSHLAKDVLLDRELGDAHLGTESDGNSTLLLGPGRFVNSACPPFNNLELYSKLETPLGGSASVITRHKMRLIVSKETLVQGRELFWYYGKRCFAENECLCPHCCPITKPSLSPISNPNSPTDTIDSDDTADQRENGLWLLSSLIPAPRPFTSWAQRSKDYKDRANHRKQLKRAAITARRKELVEKSGGMGLAALKIAARKDRKPNSPAAQARLTLIRQFEEIAREASRA